MIEGLTATGFAFMLVACGIVVMTILEIIWRWDRKSQDRIDEFNRSRPMDTHKFEDMVEIGRLQGELEQANRTVKALQGLLNIKSGLLESAESEVDELRKLAQGALTFYEDYLKLSGENPLIPLMDALRKMVEEVE